MIAYRPEIIALREKGNPTHVDLNTIVFFDIVGMFHDFQSLTHPSFYNIGFL